MSQAIPLEIIEAILYILGWQIPVFDIVDGIIGGIIDVYLFILAYSMIGKRAYPVLCIEIMDLIEWIFVVKYLMWFEVLPIWVIAVGILGRHPADASLPTENSEQNNETEQICAICGSANKINQKKCSSCNAPLER